MLADLQEQEQDDNRDTISANPLTVPAFFNAIREVSSGIARTDLWVRKVLPNGAKENDKQHPAFSLLSHKANPFTTSFEFLRTLHSSAIRKGDGFAFIDRDETGTPIGLYNLNADQVYPVRVVQRGIVIEHYYTVNTGTGYFDVPYDDMIHIMNLPSDEAGESFSALDMLKLATKKANAIQRFQYLYFQNGSHISKVVRIPGFMTPEQRKELLDNLKWINEGLKNSHKLAVLHGGAELSTVNLNAQEMELSALSEATLTDIANAVGLPGTRIGARGSISYGSLEQDNLLFAQMLDNWFTNDEAEFSAKLLRPREIDTHVIEFDRGSFLASDPSYQQLQLAKYAAKVISLDEVRSKLGESGTFEPEPEPQSPQAAAAGSQPAESGSQTNDFHEAKESAAGGLTFAALKRLKKRLVKSVAAGKYSLTDHERVIRSALDGLDATPVIEQLETMQAELDNVLPEQRQGVIEKWNINDSVNLLLA
ncbi:phage portal protein [Anatilimnocola floriformis]|uniref:phage portal protein n=1 Tax=Anatilimnocola floriformis TaxID=2948575 RepID=UPI0020C336FF|nr:phage portal protein [Anatilimnocola floriformis]